MSTVFYIFFKKDFLCNLQIQNFLIKLMCSLVPYHLCFLKLYCGYFLSAKSTIRWSLETFATMEAIDISWTLISHFTIVFVFISKSFDTQKSCFQSIIIPNIGFVWDIICSKFFKFVIENLFCKRFSIENLLVKVLKK